MKLFHLSHKTVVLYIKLAGDSSIYFLNGFVSSLHDRVVAYIYGFAFTDNIKVVSHQTFQGSHGSYHFFSLFAFHVAHMSSAVM